MAFKYHRKLTFANNAFEEFTNFPVLIIIDDSGGAYPGLTAADEIAFYDSDDVTALSWECAEFNDGGKSYYYVKVPSIAQSDTDYIWVYYGGSTSVEDKTGVWDSNYDAVYHMKDETTSTILDSTSNNNDGTKKGANEPIEITGDIGKAQDFDGNDDYIQANTGITGYPLTMEVYFKSDVSVTSNFISLNDISASSIFYNIRRSGGNKQLVLEVRNTTSYTIISPSALLNIFDWFTGATVLRSATDRELYLNGESVGVDNDNVVFSANVDKLLMGVLRLVSPAYWLNGKIAEVRISNIERSDNYIAAQDKILRQQDYVTFGEQIIELSVLDGFKLGDSVSTDMTASLVAIDGIVIGDSRAETMAAILIATDGLKLGDTSIIGMVAAVLATDGITLSDSGASVVLKSISLTIGFDVRTLTAQFENRAFTSELNKRDLISKTRMT